MLIVTATIVRRAKRMNSDIQIIHTLLDDPADCSPTESPGDEFMDTVFVTVIFVGVDEMVTTMLMVAVLVTDCTSVLVLVAMVVDVELMICVLVTNCTSVLVIVMTVVDVSVMSSALATTDAVPIALVAIAVTKEVKQLIGHVMELELRPHVPRIHAFPSPACPSLYLIHYMYYIHLTVLHLSSKLT